MTATSFIPGKTAIRQIEYFVDNLYESLFLNDTYYGNLLICLSELNELLFNNSQEKPIELSYATDHKTLTLIAKGVDDEVFNQLKTDINHNNNEITIELLKSLSDSFEYKDGQLLLTFDIGALHNSIYKERLRLLSEYFMKHKINSVD
ncbi:MAG: hypothetical protein GXO88_02835 [Chlorobi bacterium]|nr:hypothetical protein [Chlorobiota bacterium]